MSLIDRLIEPTKNYISFRDFLFHLSSSNNEPLYGVVTHLLHHDLNSIEFYCIDADYKITPKGCDDKNDIYRWLKEIQNILFKKAETWVFSDNTHFSQPRIKLIGNEIDGLGDTEKGPLTKAIWDYNQFFFKKAELLSFKPLDGLLHLNHETITDADTNSDTIEQKFADALEKIDKLEQSQAQGSFSFGIPAAHNEPKTNEQLVEALTAANVKIRDQEEDINRLNDQLRKQVDKPTEDKLLPYNSQMGVARMLHTILTIHKYDLSATKGKTNSLIENASQTNGTPVTRNFIAQWIELANQAKSDSTT